MLTEYTEMKVSLIQTDKYIEIELQTTQQGQNHHRNTVNPEICKFSAIFLNEPEKCRSLLRYNRY
jgi:hypothetical protein